MTTYVPFNVWPAPAGEGGATVHSQLTGRSAANSHPISAITGLQDALDAVTASGATVWQVDRAVIGGTIEGIVGFFGWGAAASGTLVDDDGIIKVVDQDAETITVLDPAPVEGDLLVIRDLADFVTEQFATRGGLIFVEAGGTVDLANGAKWSFRFTVYGVDVYLDGSTYNGVLAGLSDNTDVDAAMATLDSLDYATGAQGDLADSAVQPGALGTAAAADATAFASATHAGTHEPGGDDPIHAPRFRYKEQSGAGEVADGAHSEFTLTLSPLYAIVGVRTAEMDSRIRLYTDATRRTADQARSFATPPTGDHGVILDVQLNNSSKLDITPAIIGATAGAGFDAIPNGSNVYVTVTSEHGSAVTPSTLLGLYWVDLHDGLDGTPVTEAGGANPES